MTEYELLTNSKEYSKDLNQKNSNAIRVNRMIGLINLYYLSKLSPDDNIDEYKKHVIEEIQKFKQWLTKIMNAIQIRYGN